MPIDIDVAVFLLTFFHSFKARTKHKNSNQFNKTGKDCEI